MLKWDALGHIAAKLVDIRYGETIFIISMGETGKNTCLYPQSVPV